MERIKCIIQYDGHAFSGYQVQPNGRTIQAEVERSLTKMHKGKHVRVTASGRTDAGVHAKGQVLHFGSFLTIPEANWQKALNALLPKDIRVIDVKKVPNTFHARFNVVEKEYRYFILNSDQEDVFSRNYIYHIPNMLDIHAMKEACREIEGTHDFTSFCATNTDVKGGKTRTIFQASCQKVDDRVEFTFKGNGFLYNMVRILVGTLVEIGKGKRQHSEMKYIIESRDRGAAGKTAPPQGLYLWNVVYTNET